MSPKTRQLETRRQLLGDAVHSADDLLSLLAGDTAAALWALAQAIDDAHDSLLLPPAILASDRVAVLKRLARVWAATDVAARFMPADAAADVVNNVATCFYEGNEDACRARHFEGRIRHRIAKFGLVLDAAATPAIVADLVWEAWRRG